MYDVGVYAAVCVLQLMTGTVRVGDGGIMSIKRRGRRRIVRTNREDVPQVGLICLLFNNPGNTEQKQNQFQLWLCCLAGRDGLL